MPLISSRSVNNSRLEKFAGKVLLLCACISVAVTVLIIASVFFESLRFFSTVSVIDFLFGTSWSPQMALRPDQAGSSGAFGAVPVFLGTFLITIVAMLVATPIGIFSAIYISEYASSRLRNRLKPALETLAGIPTVVYGFFAVTIIAPFIKDTLALIGFDVASESAFAAGCVMGVMIIPFIMSLSEDAINSVPVSLRDASFALGATKSETIKKVILPAAFPGIISAVLLGVSRAVGETMIVVMAAGLTANLTINPFAAVTTVTVQIVTLLTGDQEFNSPKTLAAFALGLTLFLITLSLNFIAIRIVKKHRAKHG
jgi:phosphate transport system permease protein